MERGAGAGDVTVDSAACAMPACLCPEGNGAPRCEAPAARRCWGSGAGVVKRAVLS